MSKLQMNRKYSLHDRMKYHLEMMLKTKGDVRLYHSGYNIGAGGRDPHQRFLSNKAYMRGYQMGKDALNKASKLKF